jgi:hypothetical protein
MLDHLYDLLDEAERGQLLDHVAGCPACQASLEAARAQQALLARAARLHFPDVRFAAPADEPAVALFRPPSRLRRLAGWAVAAGLLLALAGVTAPAYRPYREYQAASAAVRAHDAAVAEAQRQLAAARAELARADAVRQQRLEEISREARARQLRLVVTGPRNVQPGAPADYLVKALDLNGQPAEAEVVARLTATPAAPKAAAASRARPADSARDAREAKANEELTVTAEAPGTYRVRVPPTVRYQTGQALAMQVAARRKLPGETRGERGAKNEARDKDVMAEAEAEAGEKREQVSVAGEVRLTAPVYLTHLTTDKPMYQPGEVVRFRSLTLDRYTLAPPAEEFRLAYTLTTPLGGVTTVGRGTTGVRLGNAPVQGVGAGELTLDPEAPGGEYKLAVNEELGRFPPVTRKFTVNRYQKPRLDKKLDFNKSSYGPGDDVQARVTARRADGGAVAGRPVEVTVNVDGRVYNQDGVETNAPQRGQTDNDGVFLARFRLPRDIQRGAATLAVKFDDGAVVETISRTIPVVLKKLDVEFFPEGGDLVAGLPNRVYFQARTPLGKPAQLRGTLLEDGEPAGVAVATLSDDEKPGVNQGQGVFAFTPKRGKTYELQIDSPQGITERKPLPKLHEEGVVLSVPKGVFEAGEPIAVKVACSAPRPLMVGVYCRGQLLDTAQLAAGATEAVLRPTIGAGGVCRVTVFDVRQDLKPVAERLVYRHPKERLDVSISPDQMSYVPGQKAKVSITTTAESEKPTASLALVAVVDQSVLTMADEKTDRTMPTHFLLTTEVRRAEDLEYADFLLSGHPKAPQALDLLLGTQGWRRFAEQDPERFLADVRKQAEKLSEVEKQRRADDAERLLVLSGQSAPQTTDFEQEKVERVAAEFAETAEAIQEKQLAAREALREAGADAGYAQAVETLRRQSARWERFREVGVPLGLVAVAVLGLAALILALANRTGRALACLGMTAACAALLVAAWGLPERQADGVAKSAAVAVGEENAPARDDIDRLAGRVELEAAAAKPADAPVMFGAPVPPGVANAPLPGAGGLPGPGGLGGMMPAPAAMPGGMGRGGMMPAPKPAGPARGRPMGGFAGRGLDRNEVALNRAEAADDEKLAKLEAELRIHRAAERDGLAFDLDKAKPGEMANRLGAKRLPEFEKGQARFRREKIRMGDEADRKDAKKRQLADALEPIEPLVYREYAHARAPGSTPAMRSDFAETLYWHPVLLLPDGKAEVSFDLCDSVTSFQVAVLAHTQDGRLGAATKLLESRLPFTLASKVPAEVTAGDTLGVPVAISNNTALGRQVELSVKQHAGLAMVAGKDLYSFSLPPDGRVRQVLTLKPTLSQGTATLGLEGKSEPFGVDGYFEQIRVVPEGFPVSGASGDLLEKSATHKVTLPQWLPGSLEVRVDVYPSTLADLQKGLEGLLREPHGCFEQSSTANYPNVLVLDYLKAADKSSPELEKRTRDLLGKGYQKLTSFECQDPATKGRRGYEWFGGAAPPHEALTAYGLLQFRDMARVHDVDREMLARTKAYLLAQRDGAGGFKRNERALDTFGRAPAEITNAYIVWALTEGGDDDVTTELDALAKQAKSSEDGYFLSLVGLGLTNRNRAAEARELLRAVAKQQKDDGQVASARTSITGSGGRDLVIETTALATLAWLKTDAVAFDRNVRQAVRWIGQQRGGYGAFGSTQSTILALKALIAWTNANKRTPEAGELRLFVGDEQVAHTSFPAGVDRPLTLSVPDAEKRLRPGENKLRVEITGEKNVFPHTLSWTCRTLTPPSAKDIKVKLDARLAKTELSEGDPVRLSVKVENVSGQDQGMAVAIVGLPAGLIVPEDLKQLKEHSKVVDGKKPLLGAFEIQGRELVLYWRDMAKGQAVEVPVDLIARVPGTYRGPASRAYLYYNADHKHWVEPLAATITAK